MARSTATTIEQYLEELTPERRPAVATVRALIRRSLPKGYVESLGYGMIVYVVPASLFKDTSNAQPLCYAALAAQQNYNALYLMGAYSDPAQRTELEAAFRTAKKRMDMGKSCLRFLRAEDLPLDAIGRIIASTPPEAFVARYLESRGEAQATAAAAAERPADRVRKPRVRTPAGSRGSGASRRPRGSARRASG
jgi:hypothetical protein